MGISLGKLIKAPLKLAQKGFDLGKKIHYDSHVRPLKRTGAIYQSAFDTTKHNIGNLTDKTYSPSLGGVIYREFVKEPREAQEKKKAEEQRRAADLALGRSNIASAAVLQQGQGALGDVRGGYQEALAQVDPLREAERARVTEESAFEQARQKQNAVSRGLYNTSLVADSQRGVAAETSRALADIENRYASIKAQLQAGESGALADVQSQIAAQSAQAGANASAILQNKAAALANLDYQDPGAYLSQLLGLVGTGAGLYYGQKKPSQNTGPQLAPSQGLF